MGLSLKQAQTVKTALGQKFAQCAFGCQIGFARAGEGENRLGLVIYTRDVPPAAQQDLMTEVFASTIGRQPTKLELQIKPATEHVHP